MSKLRVTNNLPVFANSSQAAFDRTLNNAGVDIIRISKIQVPKDKGALQSSGRLTRRGVCKFEASYATPYARRWEFETPAGGFQGGRKSHYLRDPGDMVRARLPEMFKVAGRNAR